MSSTGAATAFDFLIAAAAAARAHPPEPVPSTLAKEPRPMGGDAPPPADAIAAEAAGAGAVAGIPAGGCVDVLSDLEELDERAIDEACTPAGVAQALARVACRLYELADTLGGSCEIVAEQDTCFDDICFFIFVFYFARRGWRRHLCFAHSKKQEPLCYIFSSLACGFLSFHA